MDGRRSSRPTAAHDLPANAFPFTVRAFRVDTGAQAWETVVREAPVVLEIPPLARQVGSPVEIEIEYATGEKVRQSP
jgi:hypothetical protein